MISQRSILKYLENIEQTFSEKGYAQAENILDDGSFHIADRKNNLWIVRVHFENLNFETELMFKSSKLKHHTCDCDEFKAASICPHIISSYLFIRRELLLEEAAKPKPIPKKITKPRISRKPLSQLLENSSSDDILAFLLAYARKDKKLETALRVHFLSITEKSDSRQIKSILDSIIPPVSTRDRKISHANYKLLLRTLDDFKSQAGDYISLSKFGTAGKLIIECLLKIYYVIQKYPTKAEEISTWLNDFSSLSKDLFDKIEAPLKQQSLKKKFLEIVDRSYFDIVHSFDFIHALLDQELLSKKDVKYLLENLEELTTHSDKTFVHKYSLIIRLQFLAGKLNGKGLAKIQKNLMHDILIEIAQESDHNALLHCIELIQDTTRINVYGDAYLMMLIENNEVKKIREVSLDLLQQTKLFKYYDLADKYNKSQKNLDKSVNKILKDWKVEKQLDFYSHTKNNDQILALLEKENEIKHVLRYDFQLDETYDDRLLEIYKSVVAHHLESHIGNNAVEYLRKTMQHLRLHKSSKIYFGVIAFLENKYGYRKSLKTILS
jgi:hypothetical protein